MKLYARLALALCAAMCLFACSSTESETVAEQSQATTSYQAANGWASPSPPASQFCHPVYMFGANAHSQAPTYSGFAVPKWGGAVLHDRTNLSQSISAMPNSVTGQTQNSLMVATYECHNFSEFNGSGGGQSDSIGFNWPPEQNLRLVEGHQLLWDFQSACWIDSAADLSATGETINLRLTSHPNPSGWQWRLDAVGYPALIAKARCAWLGRNLVVASFHRVTPGNPAFAPVLYSTGTCFFHGIEGNLDDGWAIWRHDTPWGQWKLEVGGGVTAAEGYCVNYN